MNQNWLLQKEKDELQDKVDNYLIIIEKMREEHKQDRIDKLVYNESKRKLDNRLSKIKTERTS